MFNTNEIFIFKFVGSARSKTPVETGSEIQIGRFDVQVSDEIKLGDSQEKSAGATDKKDLRPSLPSQKMETEELRPESPNYSPDSYSPMSSPESSQEPSHSSVQPVIYHATYGKASTKMHKTYAKDGTIEVEGRKAVLKDAQNKVGRGDIARVIITTSHHLRQIIGSAQLRAPVEVGSAFLVGRWDVLVPDLVSGNVSSPYEQPKLHRGSDVDPVTCNKDLQLTDED